MVRGRERETEREREREREEESQGTTGLQTEIEIDRQRNADREEGRYKIERGGERLNRERNLGPGGERIRGCVESGRESERER